LAFVTITNGGNGVVEYQFPYANAQADIGISGQF